MNTVIEKLFFFDGSTIEINLSNECMAVTGSHAHKCYHAINKVAREKFNNDVLKAFRVFQDVAREKGILANELTIYDSIKPAASKHSLEAPAGLV